MRGQSQRGFTLVELMIALVLGLVVVGGVISVLLSNQQTYRSNQALSQVQDASRTAFEFLARDIRQAGGTPCGNPANRIANVLNNGPASGGTDWWANWSNALHGYEGNQTDPAVPTGTGVTDRVTNTDSVQLIGASGSGLSIEKHDAASATFHLYNSAAGVITPGDIVIVCSPDHAAITQITGPATIGELLNHNTGTGVPGNCTKVLNSPANCAANPSLAVPFPPNSQLAKLSANDWYIGNNNLGQCITGSAGGSAQACSLFRSTISASGGNAAAQAQEIVRGVTNMQLAYLQGGTSFVPATSVTDWGAVTAVRVTLTVAVPTNPNNPNNPDIVQRVFTNTITLRNRVG